MGENRSCKEFIPKDKTEKKTNCALCKRWNPKADKCREEIWVPLWVSTQSSEYEESHRFKAIDWMMRTNKGVRL